MNWTRATLAALVGGIAMWLVSFVLHGMVMGSTYTKYPEVFIQAEGNPLMFLVVEILIAFPAAVIFAKTRGTWAAGIGGGVVFGFWLGLVGSFAQFFSPLVMEGFPYYLAWCWFGINLIVSLVLGGVLGAMIKAP
jgi:hypothetical protein